MSSNQKALPFVKFGTKLKSLREAAKESIADVSGAVEVDNKLIATLENGESQPPEDIVLLLISHFSLPDDEAVNMWKLAGYDQSVTGRSSMLNGDMPADPPYLELDDSPIVYTDLVHVNANKYGLVINFMQGIGAPNSQPMAVAKVGMSHEHAKSMLEVLNQAMEMVEKGTKTPKKKK